MAGHGGREFVDGVYDDVTSDPRRLSQLATAAGISLADHHRFLPPSISLFVCLPASVCVCVCVRVLITSASSKYPC